MIRVFPTYDDKGKRMKFFETESDENLLYVHQFSIFVCWISFLIDDVSASAHRGSSWARLYWIAMCRKETPSPVSARISGQSRLDYYCTLMAIAFAVYFTMRIINIARHNSCVSSCRVNTFIELFVPY